MSLITTAISDSGRPPESYYKPEEFEPTPGPLKHTHAMPGDSPPHVHSTPPVELITHPAHYGGDTPYEAIKVMFAWKLGLAFCQAVILKYIRRLDEKPGADALEDAKKIRQYADFIVQYYEGKMP